ncbi:MAG: HAMP domain-containing sensor histidine kinase [Pyrinomonadaceae bacterium]|nr:HAMP domain-containing sensor histidine kinase [Pyrinomonadaceae bacterium]
MRRRKTAIFFLVLGISLSALALALNVGWIILSLREAALLVLGIVFFALIITGLILNTIFLVREIRRSEQHDAFLNSVTHELKTPIASIRLYLETLKSRPVSDEKRNEFYDIMLADSDRLLNTVEQVLHAGRSREPRRQFNVTECDLAELLGSAIALVRSRYHLADEAVRLSEPAEKFMVLGDAEDLKTAFGNLLDNAIKYSGDEPKVTVRIKRTGMKNRIAIVIRDNGIGIPPEELKRIFKRFYRVPAEGTNERKGTGLGLFIVRSIIEKHGGKIFAESKGIGHGTKFVIHLPAA